MKTPALALALSLWSVPAVAQQDEGWSFEERIVDGAVLCDLHFSGQDMTLSVLHDPARGVYTLVASVIFEVWQETGQFSILFDGPRALTIGTVDYVVTDKGRTLSVSDRGFGNVLDGLQLNDTATLVLSGFEIAVPLTGPSRARRGWPNSGTARA